MDNARGDRLGGREDGGGGDGGGGGTPGKVSLTSQMRRGPSVDDIADKVIQRLARGSAAPVEGDEAKAIAASGFAGGGSAPPQLDTIQRSFGHHDVSGTRAHVGGAAADASAALGARAYASGDQVAFAEQPDTFLIAHELAHVVQQRAGIHLSGGVGQAGDVHERHADAVAERVVRGESAEALLDEYSPSGGAPMIQRDGDEYLRPVPFPEGTSALMDAPEIDWRSTAARTDAPPNPQELDVEVAEEAPGEAPDPMDWYSPNGGPCQPRVHLPERPVPGDLDVPRFPGSPPREEEITRDGAWSSFREAFGELRASWQEMRPHVQQYNMVTEEEAENLRGAAADMRIPSGAGGSGATMGDYAELQHPGVGSRPNPISVSDLFGGPGGDSLHLGVGGSEGIHRASQRMGREFTEIDEVDGQLQAAVAEGREASHGIAAAGHGLEAALSDVNTGEREGEVRGAADRLATAEQSVDSARRAISAATAIVTLVTADSAHDAAESAGALAEHLVDALAQARLDELRGQLDAAERSLVSEVERGRLERYRQARSQLDAALARREQAQARARSALGARRRAYSDLGDSAGRHSGTRGDTRDRIRAMVASLPLLETVTSRVQAVLDAIVEPAYTRAAGHGLGLAQHHRAPGGEEFLRFLGLLRGYEVIFRQHHHYWRGRLGAVELNVRELRGNAEPERRSED